MENVATPAKRALAVLDNPPQAPATDLPPRRISKKVRSAIDAMVSGECRKINEAAQRSVSPGKRFPARCHSRTSPSAYAKGCCAIWPSRPRALVP